MFRPGDDVLLHLRGQVDEELAEAGDPDDQVPVLVRMLLGGARVRC